MLDDLRSAVSVTLADRRTDRVSDDAPAAVNRSTRVALNTAKQSADSAIRVAEVNHTTLLW